MHAESKSFWKNKKVFITGHTGFKGSWLSCWMRLLGAEVYGYSLDPITNPNHFDLLNINMHSTIGDIRDIKKLKNTLKTVQPEIVFHLAAQPIVRASYKDPIETFSTNIMGTINIFEACRKLKTVRTIINVTSDKCYENNDYDKIYTENDRLGGFDPYSTSKACSELITTSYRNSFFNKKIDGNKHEVLLASCRAGNVIGGGDWAADRLVPDIIRAVDSNNSLKIRNPNSTRPWQHVLEPLYGYILLAQKLLEGKSNRFAAAWNFGPDNEKTLTVKEVTDEFKSQWDILDYIVSNDSNEVHESKFLKIDSSKANVELDWKPIWGCRKSIQKTVEWYKKFYGAGKINTELDIIEYMESINQS